MKYEGKIVQIIENKRESYDTLVIEPPNLNKVWYFFTLIGLILFGIIYFTSLFNLKAWISYTITSLTFGLIVYGTVLLLKHRYKNLSKKVLSRERTELPIEKPHDFKVNDIVEINLEIKKNE